MGYSPWGFKELDMTEQPNHHHTPYLACMLTVPQGFLLHKKKKKKASRSYSFLLIISRICFLLFFLPAPVWFTIEFLQ